MPHLPAHKSALQTPPQSVPPHLPDIQTPNNQKTPESPPACPITNKKSSAIAHQAAQMPTPPDETTAAFPAHPSKASLTPPPAPYKPSPKQNTLAQATTTEPTATYPPTYCHQSPYPANPASKNANHDEQNDAHQ